MNVEERVRKLADLAEVVDEDADVEIRRVADSPATIDLWIYGTRADICISLTEGFDEVRVLVDDDVIEPVSEPELSDLISRKLTTH